MLVNDGEMLVNDAEMLVDDVVKWVYDPTLISPSSSLTISLLALAWSKPSFAHWTIIEKLDRLYRMSN